MPKTVAKSDLLFTVLGLVGVATIALPFTWGESPLGVVRARYEAWPYLLLAAPFFVSILISLASVRVIIFGRLSGTETVLAWLAAAGGACAPLVFLGLVLSSRPPPAGWHYTAFVTAPPVLAVAAVATLILAARTGVAKLWPLAVTAMQCTYVVNAALCLFLFWPAWQIGAYLTLATALVYVAHVVMIVWRAFGGRAKIATGHAPSTTGGST